MFGFWESILSFLIRMVGLRTDAADAAGSLHAKVKYINDTKIPTTETNLTNTVNTRQKPRGPASAPGSFSSTEAAWVTALDISGKGKLCTAALYQSSTTNPQIRITVDGYQLANGASNRGAAGYSYPTNLGFYAHSSEFNDTGNPRNAEINFKTSLKIELNSVSGNSSTVYWLYEIE